MDGTILLLLVQDGLTTGAIYLLLALGLLIAFSVTGVVLIPQGDFVALGALSFAAMLSGRVPPLLWVLDALALACALLALRRPRPARAAARALLPALCVTAAVLLAVRLAAPPVLEGALVVLMVALLGPPLWRLVFRPMPGASVLALLVAAVALHEVLLGLGLLLFGPEAARTPALSDATLSLGGVDVSGQSLWIWGTCAVLVAGLRWLFRATLSGRALRASASNPLGARLVGIDAESTGGIAFALAAGLGALAGLLVAPITPLAYDSGFLIGLKGFVAAVLGGLASFPVAALGALALGVVESLGSFLASAYGTAIVFGLLLPALAWLSLRARPSAE